MINIPHEQTPYKLTDSDRQHISDFLEIANTYNLFVVYKDGASNDHYYYLDQLNILAYALSIFDKQQCIRLVESCGGKDFDPEKYHDVFTGFYINALETARRNDKLSGVQKELCSNEIAHARMMNASPTDALLPDRYKRAKETVWKNGIWVKPFHEALWKLLAWEELEIKRELVKVLE
jgi:hypothetical protein